MRLASGRRGSRSFWNVTRKPARIPLVPPAVCCGVSVVVRRFDDVYFDGELKEAVAFALEEDGSEAAETPRQEEGTVRV